MGILGRVMVKDPLTAVPMRGRRTWLVAGETSLEKIPPLAVLNFDQPIVGIEFALTGQISVSVGFLRPFQSEARRPEPLSISCRNTRWGWTEKSDCAVEAVDLDVNDSGRVIAAANDHRWYVGGSAAADIGHDPDGGLYSHNPKENEIGPHARPV